MPFPLHVDLCCPDPASVQVELYLNHDLYRHRVSVIHRRLELVLADSFNSLLIESHAEVPGHMHILRIALCIDDQLN